MFTIILGIGVTLLNGTVYNMNKPGYSFNAILSSPSFISIFLAVESTFLYIQSIYKKRSKFRHNSSLWCAFFLTTLNSMERKWCSWFLLWHWPNCKTKGSERMRKPFSEFLSCQINSIRHHNPLKACKRYCNNSNDSYFMLNHPKRSTKFNL